MKQAKIPIFARFLPRLRDILFIAIFIGALLDGSAMLNTDSDLGRHLTLGRIILETHQIPTRDLLSFTKPDQPRPPYEWLAQVLFTIAFRLLKLDGVVLFTAFVIATSFLLVYADATHRSNAPILTLTLTAWAAIASSLHWLTRPHIFSFLFLAIWLHCLERIRTNKPVSLWAFPALMLIWANMHGGFIFGFLAWLAYCAGWLWQVFRKQTRRAVGKRLLIIGSISFIASIATPDLWHNWQAVFNNQSAFILNRTIETTPPNFRSPSIWPFAGLLVATTLLAFLNRKRVVSSHFFLLAGLAAMGLAMARNIPLFAIAAAPILVEWTRQIFVNENVWTRLENGFSSIDAGIRNFFIWPIIVVIAAAAFLLFHKTKTQTTFFQFDPRVFPVQAANWIEMHPMQENVFNDFNWGGYLLYRLWPNQRVFIDSQSDFYGEGFLRQYEQVITTSNGWESVLNQYKIQWVIIPINSPLASTLAGMPEWQVAYSDQIAIILSRK